MDLAPYLADGGMSWVVDGGESGSGRRAAGYDWFRGIRDVCAEASVPYFHKQGNAHRPGQDGSWTGGRGINIRAECGRGGGEGNQNMTNASELQIPAQVAECFSDARAYVGKAIDELSDLVSNMEDARDNLQDHFAGSEQVEALEIGIDSVDELVSSLDQLDWPGDIPASELPPPVQVASAPLVTRGSRKGSPKRLFRKAAAAAHAGCCIRLVDCC